ncbi:reverse transcriptase [Penicillium bovifimosum]|uniref:Reverse transcriptase n=1 Tax=Penicillium bovifimosum TaxID=126998 RepID=A0A9W9HEX6_9EURO|nr:reverse transcriptase [Penicillium bovifimosum]KAJ5145642.1 reverse transcriptase [Penicillium bovifimosum]
MLIKAETGQISSSTTYSSMTLGHSRNELSKCPHGEHIILGIMTAHHPRWGGLRNRADRETKQLLEIVNKWGLKLATQQGTWSRSDQSSAIDLTFITSNLVNRLIICERAGRG